VGRDFATPLHFLFLFTLVSTLCVVFAEYYGERLNYSS
jgi:hypothetical protein